MREAKEIERLGFTQTPCPPTLGGVPAELDQARLLRVQFQRELRESLAEFMKEPLRIVLILKTHDEESRPGESHPRPLAEPDLNLSTHPAPIAQPSGRNPKRQ